MTHSFFNSQKSENGDLVYFELDVLKELLDKTEWLSNHYVFLSELIYKNKIYFLKQKDFLSEFIKLKATITNEKNNIKKALETIRDLIERNEARNLPIIKKMVQSHEASFNELVKNLFDLKSKIKDIIAPITIGNDHPAYRQSIKRVCFRGEGRPPYANDGAGVFQIGCTKKIADPFYDFMSSRRTLSSNQIICPYVSNTTNSVGVSKFPESAVLFPLEFVDYTKLKVNHLISNLQEIINMLANASAEKLNIEGQVKAVDIHYLIKLGLENITDTERKNTLIEMKEKNYIIKDENTFNYFISFLDDILSVHYNNEIATLLIAGLKDFLHQLLPYNNKTWLYAVYIDEGCDVTSHGYRTAINANTEKNKHLIFAFEICVDQIPPQHVVAAYEVERNVKEIRVDGEIYKGKAQFVLKNIQYNPVAVKYFTDKGIDIKPYQKMLEKYMKETQQSPTGREMHLSEHGWTPNRKM